MKSCRMLSIAFSSICRTKVSIIRAPAGMISCAHGALRREDSDYVVAAGYSCQPSSSTSNGWQKAIREIFSSSVADASVSGYSTELGG